MEGLTGLTPSRASIGTWTVDRYVDLLRWPLVIGMIATVMILTWWSNFSLVTAVSAALVAFTGWRVARRGGRRVEALATGFIAGFILGLTSAVKKFITTTELVWAINIISETLLTAIVGALLCLSATLLSHQLRR